MVREIVETEGRATVRTVSTPAEALEFVQHLRPTLIVLDARLAERGGTTLCQQLKADPITAATPVIALLPEDAGEELRATGCDVYLALPFTADDLARTIRGRV